MTTDALRETKQGAVAVEARDGHGRRSDDRPTTVQVIPLWDRLRTGARG